MTTAEERARGIMARLRQDCADAICTYLDCPSCGCMAYLAQSIREAEDAALERAIACVSDNFVNGEGHYAIEAIRSLKHNKG